MTKRVTRSHQEMRATPRSIEAQLELEEEQLAHLRGRLGSGELTLDEAHRELVGIVLGRLDGGDPIVRGLMRAKLLDFVERTAYFARAAHAPGQ